MLQVLREVLRRRGGEGWLVGGTVRDERLGRFSPDIDVVVTDDPAAVADEMSAALRLPCFALSTRHGAYRVVGRDSYVDIAGMRGQSILDDLAQRDFTINAMARPVSGSSDGELVDPSGGAAHLDEGLLVAVNDRIFDDDPVRLMRAVRFVHLLGFRTNSALDDLLRSRVSLLSGAAMERIVCELALMLEAGRAAAAVRLLDERGLLLEFLPELETVKADSPHWLAPTEALDQILDKNFASDLVWGPALRARMDTALDGTFSRTAGIKFASVLHSLRPAAVGALGRRLKLSGDATALVEAVATWHERNRQAGRTVEAGLEAAAGSARAATEFFWDTKPWEPEVILAAAASAAAEAAANVSVERGEAGAVALAVPVVTPAAAGVRLAACAAAALSPDSPADGLLTRWLKRDAGLPAAPFDGGLLMAELGLREGPLLGRVLKETRLAWESGEIADREGALASARATLAAARAL